MYKNLSESAWFCRPCDRNIWGVFGLQFQLLFTYKTRMLSFTRQCSCIIHVSWKVLKLLYRKFIQDNVYQILSESTGFCRRYDKTFGVFFGSQCRSNSYIKVMRLRSRSQEQKVCHVWVVSCERLDLQASLFVCSYVFRTSPQDRVEHIHWCTRCPDTRVRPIGLVVSTYTVSGKK